MTKAEYESGERGIPEPVTYQKYGKTYFKLWGRVFDLQINN